MLATVRLREKIGHHLEQRRRKGYANDNMSSHDCLINGIGLHGKTDTMLGWKTIIKSGKTISEAIDVAPRRSTDNSRRLFPCRKVVDPCDLSQGRKSRGRRRYRNSSMGGKNGQQTEL